MTQKSSSFKSLLTSPKSLFYNKIWHHLGTAAKHSKGDIYRLPPFLWRGDSGQGKWLCNGYFSVHGQHIAHNGQPWQNDTIMTHPFWCRYATGFCFLEDLRALNGDLARQAARHLVQSWIHQNSTLKLQQMNCAATSTRIANWLLHYDFFGQTASEELITQMTQSLIRQTNALAHYPQKHIAPQDSLKIAKALILSGLYITDQERSLERGLQLLKSSLNENILFDGGHISRNPEMLLDWACDAMDIHHSMQRCHFYEADYLPPTLDRMATALRFFSYPAEELPFFHGTTHPQSAKINAFFKIYDNNKRRKSCAVLEQSGYYKMQKGRTSLIIDGGTPPGFRHNTHSHAGLGAFEMHIGKEKLITNCGSHMLSPDFAQSLKYTAAHSTLILDDRNSCEILPDGHIGRAPETPRITYRELSDKSLSIDVTHNGYMPALATTHTRHISLGANGDSIKGMDSLTSDMQRPAPLEYCLRFHLAPMVQASLIKEATEVLLRLPSGKGANFYAYGHSIRIEDSIMMGKDTIPRKTKQLVVEGRFSGGLEQMPWLITIKN